MIKKTIKDYEDMLDIEWPKESLRAKMPLKDRAKIFLPFAALKGYEESLDLIRKKLDEDESFKRWNMLHHTYDYTEIKE